LLSRIIEYFYWLLFVDFQLFYLNSQLFLANFKLVILKYCWSCSKIKKTQNEWNENTKKFYKSPSEYQHRERGHRHPQKKVDFF